MKNGGSTAGGGGGNPQPPPPGGMNQYLPTRKVTVGGLAGAISIVFVWVANTFWMPSNAKIPAEIASAITTILTFAVSYFVPDPPG